MATDDDRTAAPEIPAPEIPAPEISTEPASPADPPWTRSPLVSQIIATLPSADTLDDLAERLDVTDSRILFYLERLVTLGWVSHDDDHWKLTAAAPSAVRPVVPERTTTLPLGSQLDYQQAYADAAAGMFGDSYVQLSGEHGGRVHQHRVEEFSQRLAALISEYFGPETIDRSASPKYGFRWVLTPVDLHPIHDQPDA